MFSLVSSAPWSVCLLLLSLAVFVQMIELRKGVRTASIRAQFPTDVDDVDVRSVRPVRSNRLLQQRHVRRSGNIWNMCNAIHALLNCNTLQPTTTVNVCPTHSHVRPSPYDQRNRSHPGLALPGNRIHASRFAAFGTRPAHVRSSVMFAYPIYYKIRVCVCEFRSHCAPRVVSISVWLKNHIAPVIACAHPPFMRRRRPHRRPSAAMNIIGLLLLIYLFAKDYATMTFIHASILAPGRQSVWKTCDRAPFLIRWQLQGVGKQAHVRVCLSIINNLIWLFLDCLRCVVGVRCARPRWQSRVLVVGSITRVCLNGCSIRIHERFAAESHTGKLLAARGADNMADYKCDGKCLSWTASQATPHAKAK